MAISDEKIKELLFALEEPVVFKNVLKSEGPDKWELLDWSLEDLAEKVKDQKLPFRTGYLIPQQSSPWIEESSDNELKSLNEFLDFVNDNSKENKKWLYFDYKYMKEWFQDKPDILKSLNWKNFGFDLNGRDSTMWIGSKGAHTNCHQDTYGCNLVSQIHGRKLWLLFSPKCTNRMQPTRLPYEESTIFSKYDFFNPNKKEIQVMKNMSCNSDDVKTIILEPNDVLFIPRGWWHYVESLETSMSVNVWLPVKEDCDSRLKESLVHLIANTIGEDLARTTQEETDLVQCIQLIESSLDECKKLREKDALLKNENAPQINDITSILKDLNVKYNNCCSMVPNFSSDNLKHYLEKVNTNRFDNDFDDNYDYDEPSTFEILEAVVDAFCHRDVTSHVSQILKDKFLKKE